MKVKHVSEITYNGYVYNFHCLPNENYFTSNALVHNCYKGNTNKPAHYMTLDTFKLLMGKLPRINDVLFAQQLAFGVTGVQSNPHFIPIMQYTRSLGVIPNFTLSGFDLTDEIAEQCADVVGAVAASVYPADKELGYRTVRKFLDLGVKQTNIHLLYHNDNEAFIYEVLHDVQYNPLLRGLNAVVLLGLKPKNRGSNFTPATNVTFTDIVNYAIRHKVPLGFDSCSATKFNHWLDQTMLVEDKESVRQFVEPCESFGLFSSYINVDCFAYPCSFAEEQPGWEEGMNVLACSDFIRDIWFSDRLSTWRQRSLDANRQCILYPEIN